MVEDASVLGTDRAGPRSRASAEGAGATESLCVRSLGLDLHGERWPAGGEPRGSVLLLPGGGQTRHAWDASAVALQRGGWTAVTFDLRGHGDSDWDPDGDYSVETVATDVATILDSLAADPPVLVGASLSGLAGLLAAGQDVGRCRAVALVDVALRVEPEGGERIRAFMKANPDGFASVEEAAAAIRAYRGERSRPANLERLARNLRRGGDGRWRWHWDPRLLERDDDTEGREHPVRARLEDSARRLQVPVLLVRGLLSDVVSDESLDEALALMPDARVAEVSDAGHMVAGDDNETFIEAIMRFLEEL